MTGRMLVVVVEILLNWHDKSDFFQVIMIKAPDSLLMISEQNKSVSQYISQAYAEKVEEILNLCLAVYVIISLAKRRVPL